MTKAQYEREKLRLVREKELRLLAEAERSSDPRYVESAVDSVWSLIFDRKLRMRDSLPHIERRRLTVLEELYS